MLSAIKVVPNTIIIGYEVVYDNYCVESVCPIRDGVRDFGYLTITMSPDKLIPDIISIPTYLKSFCNVPMMAENVVYKVFVHFKKILKPRYLRVVGTYPGAIGYTQHRPACNTIIFDTRTK